MTPDGTTPENRKIAFELWKLQLRKDCEQQDKILSFNALSEYTMQLLWEEGIDPTVAAIVAGATKPKENPLRESLGRKSAV